MEGRQPRTVSILLSHSLRNQCISVLQSQKPREAAPWGKMVSFQDYVDKRSLDSSAECLWREIFHSRHFHFLWVLRKTGELESLSVLVPVGLIKCQELSPEAEIRGVHSEVVQTRISLWWRPVGVRGIISPARLRHTQRNPKRCSKSFPVWRRLCEPEAQSVAEDLVKIKPNLVLGKKKLGSTSCSRGNTQICKRLKTEQEGAFKK